LIVTGKIASTIESKDFPAYNGILSSLLK